MGLNSSWFTGLCVECKYPIVVYEKEDYIWYCSNKDCINHHPGEHTGDMEVPKWVDF